MNGAGNGVNNNDFVATDCSRYVTAGSEDSYRDLSEVAPLKSTVEEWLGQGSSLSARRLKAISTPQNYICGSS
jgi:hypothetical protein